MLDVTIKDSCLGCGHYHDPPLRNEKRDCTVKGCFCKPKDFIPRSFSHKM